MKRVLFMGTPDYATIILDRLIKEGYEIVALFTQPDKKVGRKQILTFPHIKQYIVDNNIQIPCFQPNNLKDENIATDIKELNPDFIIVAAYGQILPKTILDIAPCINLHASLLPNYRGASPIQEGLLNDDLYLGVTSMLMEEGLDSGDILGFEYLKNSPIMEVSEAFEKLSNIAANLTIDTLTRYDLIKPIKQKDYQVSFCKKIKKEYGEVDFSDAKELFLKYKAYSYWPGIFLNSGLKLKDIKLIDTNSLNTEGELLKINDNSIIIGCKYGKIEVSTLQAPSKKALNAVEFVRGQRLALGEIIS